MDIKKSKWKSKLQKTFAVLVLCVLGYVFSYILDSFFGGYWIIAEMDGRDRYSFGLAIPTAFLWQPYFGHEAIGNQDFPGAFYTPLIRIDRKFIHPTIYLSDHDGLEKASNLKSSQVHPHWRDEYSTKVTGVAVRDETNQVIKCTLHYTNSKYPREISEIRIKHDLVAAMQLSAPEGFSLKDATDTYYKIVSKTDVVWTGALALVKDQDITVAIPAKNPMAGKGHIAFYYARIDDNSGDFHGDCWIELK